MLIHDNMTLHQIKIARDKGVTLHNDTRINPPGGYNKSKFVCTQQRSFKMYE